MMDWRDIRSFDELTEWTLAFEVLPQPERERIMVEMTELIENETQTARDMLFQTLMTPPQVEQPLLRVRRRRTVRS